MQTPNASFIFAGVLALSFQPLSPRKLSASTRISKGFQRPL